MSKDTSTTEEPLVAEEAIADSEAEVAEDLDRLANLTPEEMIIELQDAERKAAENYDRAIRAQAELENVRRRAERDVAAAHKFGSEKLIRDLLAVVDSLERGLTECGTGEDTKAMREGMDMTLKLLLDTLVKQGIKVVNPEGLPFNPAEMEAISMVPNDKVDPNTVLTVVQKGYLLNERLLRPAMVVVSK